MDQDDLFQEITIQVWHSIPNFRGEFGYYMAISHIVKYCY